MHLVSSFLPRRLKALLLPGVVCLSLGLTTLAPAQVLYIASYNDNTVGSYDLTTGNPINTALISGLDRPFGLALYGSALYVANYSSDTIGRYDLSNGTYNASFISNGLSGPQGLAISDATLYVANSGNNTIGSYDLSNDTAHSRINLNRS